jgi:hypothetical protein
MNKLLWWAGGAFLLLIYPFTFGKTGALYSQCIELENKSSMISGAPGRIRALEQESARLDQVTGTRDTGSISQQALLGLVTSYCQKENILLQAYPAPRTRQENDFLIETHALTLEGPFKSLLNLVYRIEQKEKTGKVASVDYMLKEDPRTHKRTLNATIYVQQVHKNRSDKQLSEK